MGKHEPMFITRSETFKFVAGETIHLPCEVANVGKLKQNRKFILIFKKKKKKLGQKKKRKILKITKIPI